MNFEEYRKFAAVGLADLVKTGQIKPSELLDIAIQRTGEVNPQINAVVTDLHDFARKSLKNINYNSPFAGVPFLLKDLGLQLKGTRYTNASRLQKDYISSETSTVVQRAIDGGFVIFGKTNTSEFGLNPFVENNFFRQYQKPLEYRTHPGRFQRRQRRGRSSRNRTHGNSQ